MTPFRATNRNGSTVVVNHICQNLCRSYHTNTTFGHPTVWSLLHATGIQLANTQAVSLMWSFHLFFLQMQNMHAQCLQ